jgi:hypothetical protein
MNSYDVRSIILHFCGMMDGSRMRRIENDLRGKNGDENIN